MPSCVYVATNAYFPGLVKIGVSTNLAKRHKALSNSSVPTPFKIAFHLDNEHAALIEKRVHLKLDGRRLTTQREFFQCTAEEAAVVIRECAVSIDSEMLINQNSEDHSKRDRIYKLREITDEQQRQSINIDDLYDGWLRAAQERKKGRLRWKSSNGRDYLYLLRVGSDTGRRMGARSERTEALYEQGRAYEVQEKNTWERLLAKGRMFKAVRLPTVPKFIGAALRELDKSKLLGKHVLVIGSPALHVYEMESWVRFPHAFFAIESLTLAWATNAHPKNPPEQLIDALRNADNSWANTGQSGQLKNRTGDIINIVVAPELVAGYPKRESVRPKPIEGQGWLLGGVPMEHVVVGSDAKPAKMIVPDPRLFALHKLFLSELSDRGCKKDKDKQQGLLLLKVIAEHMPHYPLDDEFREALPAELGVYFDRWKAQVESTPAKRHSP